MEPWQERLVAENDELQVRLDKLESFIVGPLFGQLSPTHRHLLKAQAGVMRAYWEILAARIQLDHITAENREA